MKAAPKNSHALGMSLRPADVKKTAIITPIMTLETTICFTTALLAA